uniref:Uncharacterized protein n=1 Tax=Spironucleus salmonicida TaxID=348837 RepID=V6LFN7_9EUKA|eukprot:EST42521.1 Hypothetical protein SS50377_17833 [Spironucleus salmonicida]
MALSSWQVNVASTCFVLNLMKAVDSVPEEALQRSWADSSGVSSSQTVDCCSCPTTWAVCSKQVSARTKLIIF